MNIKTLHLNNYVQVSSGAQMLHSLSANDNPGFSASAALQSLAAETERDRCHWWCQQSGACVFHLNHWDWKRWNLLVLLIRGYEANMLSVRILLIVEIWLKYWLYLIWVFSMWWTCSCWYWTVFAVTGHAVLPLVSSYWYFPTLVVRDVLTRHQQ